MERLKGRTDELARLEEMAEYARNYYAEDLAGLMGYLPTVRKYETIAPKTHNPHGIYTVSEAISRPLSDDELAKKRRDRARAE